MHAFHENYQSRVYLNMCIQPRLFFQSTRQMDGIVCLFLFFGIFPPNLNKIFHVTNDWNYVRFEGNFKTLKQKHLIATF